MNRINRTIIVVFVIPIILSISCNNDSTRKVEIFHKDKTPSLRTLERTKTVLQKHENNYEIDYYLITDPGNIDIIRKYRLPDTHFPFAVVIDGKYSASIDGRTVYFLEFPQFMKGIGRHEGNWSMEDLDKVLSDPDLLLDKNILPASLKHDDDEPCPGEQE